MALTDPARSDPARILVTSGSQQALDLIARVLSCAEGTPTLAAIEDPAYVGALQVLRSHRYILRGIPVDGNGLQTEILATALTQGWRPDLCYINPTFQNPTGAVLSPARARHLLDLAEEFGFMVIADDPYRELYLEGTAPVALPESPHLIRLGSISKVIAPGLRIGWVDAEPAFIARLELAKQAADLHTSTLNQLMVHEMISDDHWWLTHRATIRAEYRHRRDHLLAAIDHHLPDQSIRPQRGGFFHWMAPRPGANPPSASTTTGGARGVTPILSAALEAGVAIVPGTAFAVDQPNHGSMRLSYSSGDPSRFDEAIARLARALGHRTQPR